MCGRYVNAAKKEQIRKEFRALVSNSVTDKPRYNIAPAQMIDVVLNQEAKTVLTQLSSELVKRRYYFKGLINARAETLLTLSAKASMFPKLILMH